MILGRHIVSRRVAAWQIERFAWLIEQHCPKLGPLRSAFQTYDGEDLCGMPPYDPAAPEAWAQAYFRAFLTRINFPEIPVMLVMRDKVLPKCDDHKELTIPPRNQSHERYYTDQYGRPVIYAEPSKLSIPGYLARRLTVAISDQIQMSTRKSDEISNDKGDELTALTAIFLGLGLVMTSHSRRDDPSVMSSPNIIDSFNRPNESEALFATAIYWSVKGYQHGQALSIHGPNYSLAERKSLDQAYKQLRSYSTDIERLRSMAIKADRITQASVSIRA